MNNYKNYLYMMEDNAHLISMVPVEELIRFGYEIGLDKNCKVLDLCCGYGTLLKVWSETFGITGAGVDICQEFLSIGRERLVKYGIEKVTLHCEDVKLYQDSEKYDVVICSETIDSISETLCLGSKFLKPGGLLAYQKLFSKIEIPPKKLVEFDAELLSLSELNHVFNENGFQITSMASDTNGMWEKYVLNWNGKRDLLRLKQDIHNQELKNWIKQWYDMYFDYRRQYEGQAMFGLQRIV